MTPPIKLIEKVLRAEGDARDRLMEQTNAELGEWILHPAGQHYLSELAFQLMGLAWKDGLNDNIIDRIIETKRVALGATDYIDDRTLRGLMAYWQGVGGRIMSGVLRYDQRIPMPKEAMVAAINMHADELATNFWGRLTDLQARAEEKIRMLPVIRLVAMIAEALPTGSTVDGEAVSGTYAHATVTEANLDAILLVVGKHSTGGVSILGSENSLAVFGRLGAQYDSIAERIFTQGTGFIGQYKGRPLVQIENSEDFYGEDILPDNELWFVGNNAGRMTFYGQQAKTQVRNLEAFYQAWETEREAGMLLHGAEVGRVGRVILT